MMAMIRAALACSRPDRRPPGGLDALLGAVGQDQGDDGAQRRADEEPDDGDHQRRGGQSLGLWALTQSFASTCRSGFHSSS
jgi:hypothetical protein